MKHTNTSLTTHIKNLKTRPNLTINDVKIYAEESHISKNMSIRLIKYFEVKLNES